MFICFFKIVNFCFSFSENENTQKLQKNLPKLIIKWTIIMCDTMGLNETAELVRVIAVVVAVKLTVPVLQLSVEQQFMHVVILPNVTQPVMEHVS